LISKIDVEKVLEYLGKAVAVAEERTEIEKVRLLQHFQTPTSDSQTVTPVTTDNVSNPTDGDDEGEGVKSEEAGGSGESMQLPEDVLQEVFKHIVSSMAQAAADAAVDGLLESFEQLVSPIACPEEAAAAATSGMQAPQDDEEDPGDYPQLLQRQNHFSSLLSSSSSSSGSNSSEFSSDEEVDEEKK